MIHFTKASTMPFIIVLMLFSLSCNIKTESNKLKPSRPLGLDTMLNDWANCFIKKVDTEYSVVVNFVTPDSSNNHHVSIHCNQVSISDSISPDANFTFKASLKHYAKIYNKEITAFTSMGRESMADSTPLDFDFHKAITKQPMNDLLFFVQHFFTTSPHDKVILGKEHSKIVHGGHAIPLFYQKSNDIGVRSAWYLVEKGQQINEIGDTNPFPQYFIIKQGQGFAKIGADTLRVKANEAYFIAPGADHVFWTESNEPMELIFLAWGEGA